MEAALRTLLLFFLSFALRDREVRQSDFAKSVSQHSSLDLRIGSDDIKIANDLDLIKLQPRALIRVDSLIDEVSSNNPVKP